MPARSSCESLAGDSLATASKALAGLCQRVEVHVGGRPLRQPLGAQVGPDGASLAATQAFLPIWRSRAGQPVGDNVEALPVDRWGASTAKAPLWMGGYDGGVAVSGFAQIRGYAHRRHDIIFGRSIDQSLWFYPV